MHIVFPWEQSDILPKKYSAEADKNELWHGVNLHSFPFLVEELPKEAQWVSFALIDYSATETIGFPWVHWNVANAPVDQERRVSVSPENASINHMFLRGTNSFQSNYFKKKHFLLALSGDYLQLTRGYGGTFKKSAVHQTQLTLHVWATKQEILLDGGFTYSQLLEKLKESGAVGSASTTLLV